MTAIDLQVDVTTCAEDLLFVLRAHGVEFLFLNPGTDSAPLQEAAAALETRSVPAPKVVTCPFESVALAAAHGYWQVTRQPQAVFVHVDVGTQNLGAIVHDVLRDRAGVLVLAGKAPYGVDAGSRGGRSHLIHWQQDVPDQAGIIRSYAKWIGELTRSEDTPRVVGRAVQVAAAGRPGLAYLMLSRDVLMGPAAPAGQRRLTGFARPVPPAIEPGALAELAEMLARALRPVVVTSRVGRAPQGARFLARLAEIAAVPVAGRPEAVNISTSHPMRARPSDTPVLIAQADLILLIDCDVPWVPRTVTPAEGARVVQIDIDPVKADMPLWAFPVDLAITADGTVAVGQLAEAIQSAGGVPEELAQARRTWLASVTGRRSPAAAQRGTDAGSPEVPHVIAALNALLRPTDVVVEEAVSNDGMVLDLIERPEPGTLCSPGGPGLGWALGASVGIKLARPRDRVVAVVGDGAFMFGVPPAALCLAAEARAPFVAVVLNNNGYRATRSPVTSLFPQGAAVARGDVPGTRFTRPPDFVALARACGAYAERVDDNARLMKALEHALKASDDGQPAVIDVAITNQ